MGKTQIEEIHDREREELCRGQEDFDGCLNLITAVVKKAKKDNSFVNRVLCRGGTPKEVERVRKILKDGGGHPNDFLESLGVH